MCESTPERGPENYAQNDSRENCQIRRAFALAYSVHCGTAEDTLVMIHRSSFLVAVVLGAVVTGCGDGSRAAAPPPPPIGKAEPVVERDVPISAEWVGTLVGYISAQIRPRIS